MVYSVRFLNGPVFSVATATAWRYTVPAGKVAVVRSLDVYVAGVGKVLVGMPGISGSWFFSTVGVPVGQSRGWEGRQVFRAGETFGAQWTDGDVNVMASGYLLNATP